MSFNTILIKKDITEVTMQAMGPQPAVRQLVLRDPRPHFYYKNYTIV